MPRDRHPTRDYHPAKVQRAPVAKGPRPKTPTTLKLPRGERDIELEVDGATVRLTNLPKLFWPEEGITKRDLIQYYADVSSWLLPHLKDRAMVMKRYPNGAGGDFFFMKRAPSPRPDWIATCAVKHASQSVL